ncbi:MAG: hypothetical protein OXC99_06285 [Chloroflexi bacterium]|nr:hypothetical protein [Chloroflexota bacterium]
MIISLLGRKPDGKSEFRFYPFHGNWDSVEERRDKPSFQEWLDRHHSDMSLSVIEHPTVDQGIETEKAKMIAAEVVRLTSLGRTVVVVDSAGVSRTGKVAKVLRTWSEVVHATAPSE